MLWFYECNIFVVSVVLLNLAEFGHVQVWALTVTQRDAEKLWSHKLCFLKVIFPTIWYMLKPACEVTTSQQPASSSFIIQGSFYASSSSPHPDFQAPCHLLCPVLKLEKAQEENAHRQSPMSSFPWLCVFLLVHSTETHGMGTRPWPWCLQLLLLCSLTEECLNLTPQVKCWVPTRGKKAEGKSFASVKSQTVRGRFLSCLAVDRWKGDGVSAWWRYLRHDHIAVQERRRLSYCFFFRVWSVHPSGCETTQPAGQQSPPCHPWHEEMLVNIWSMGVRRMGLNSFQRCPATGQGAMGTNSSRGSSIWTWGRTSLWGWWSTETGCPEWLWILCLWRYSRPSWTRSCAACCRWPCFGRRVGLDDPQRSLPTPNILWFCVILSVGSAWATTCPVLTTGQLDTTGMVTEVVPPDHREGS